MVLSHNPQDYKNVKTQNSSLRRIPLLGKFGVFNRASLREITQGAELNNSNLKKDTSSAYT
jgi:hypothetical protein